MGEAKATAGATADGCETPVSLMPVEGVALGAHTERVPAASPRGCDADGGNGSGYCEAKIETQQSTHNQRVNEAIVSGDVALRLPVRPYAAPARGLQSTHNAVTSSGLAGSSSMCVDPSTALSSPHASSYEM